MREKQEKAKRGLVVCVIRKGESLYTGLVQHFQLAAVDKVLQSKNMYSHEHRMDFTYAAARDGVKQVPSPMGQRDVSIASNRLSHSVA